MIIIYPSQQSESAPFNSSATAAPKQLLYHAGPVPVSPTSTAASKLADALDKLRQVHIHVHSVHQPYMIAPFPFLGPYQVDMILEQLGVFWANTEVVLELLTKKGQHVEHFIGFANKPRLMQRSSSYLHTFMPIQHIRSVTCIHTYIQDQNSQNSSHRFLERLEEYKRFWENVSIMCRNYLMGMQNSGATQGGTVGTADGHTVY